MVRNVLAHRGLPGRLIEFGNTTGVGGEYQALEGVTGVRLDAATTGIRQSWLSGRLSGLVAATSELLDTDFQS